VLDAAKQGLDQRIAATLDPVTLRVIPGQGADNIALTELRDALVRQLDAVPEYAAARAAWAGPTQSMEAMARGQGALRANPDEVAAIVARISPSDMDFFRLGMGRAVADSASDPSRAAEAARRLVEDRNMQRRLESAIPDPAQREQFIQAMRQEVEMAGVERTISPRANSHTGRLRAGGDDMARDPPGGMLASLLLGRPVEAARQGMGHIYRATQGINSTTSDALAARLFETDPAAQREILARLLQQREGDRLTALARSGLAQQLLRGVGAGSAMTVN
jgi:hypothetical protein